uniref:Uncharacterized protein n=1 Tax=candidate division CPR3 bacterium TaxID=2268181 RepID=A0A7C5YXP6_UNCC3
MGDFSLNDLSYKLEQLSDKISSEFLKDDRINLSEKVAQASYDNKFNDDQTQRLLEMTNLAVYSKIYNSKEASGEKDRIIEFKIAKKDEVDKIKKKLLKDDGASSVSDVPMSLEEIEDKHPDLGVIIKKKDTHFFESREGEKPKGVGITIIKLRKLSSDIDMEYNQKQARYLDLLDELSSKFASMYSYDLDKFASEVLSIYQKRDASRVDGPGETGFASSVLDDIYTNLRRKPGNTKIAEGYVNPPKKEWELFKRAVDAVAEMFKLNKAKVIVKEMIKRHG